MASTPTPIIHHLSSPLCTLPVWLDSSSLIRNDPRYMRLKFSMPALLCLLGVLLSPASAQPAATLPGTQPLTAQGDLSAQLVAGIDKSLLRELERPVSQ